MRTLPIVLAAAGAISLLAAAAPAKADWDDHGRSGWRDRDWRTEEWREHHHAWSPGYSWRPGYYGYGYGYAPPIVRYRPPVVRYGYAPRIVVVPRY
jgi:hypothetical protein